MKPVYKIFMASFISLVCACSDDVNPDGLDSQLKQEGDVTISCFNLNKSAFRIPASVEYVSLRLVTVKSSESSEEMAKWTRGNRATERDTIHLAAKIIVGDQKIRIETSIPKGISLNEEYILTLHPEQGMRRYAGGVKATFDSNLMVKVGDEAPSYRGLEGEGTEESPYLIGNADDFLSFLNNLRRDEIFSGSELFFRQTADFTAPTQSSIVDGRGYYGFKFAGIYDGNNHKIDNLYYIGDRNSDKDSYIGLFPELHDGATIRNLTLSNVNISRAYNNVGALCGYSMGNVSISNVSVSGNISDCNSYVGGLVGYALGSLTVDGYDMAVNVDGCYNTGGAVGEFNGRDITISHVTTKSHRFSVLASDSHAGGIIGYGLVEGKLNLNNIELEHTVSAEDADVKIIHGEANAGGLIGTLSDSNEKFIFDNIEISCPVSTDESYAGGLIGLVNLRSGIQISGCRVKSIVSGETSIGGFFGEAECDNAYIEFAGPDGSNCFETDLSAAGIKAGSKGGGLIGQLLNCTGFKGSKVKIAANVNVSGECAGGVIGYSDKSDVDPSFFDVNTLMRVKGTSKVGGIIGQSSLGSIADSKNPVFDVERTPQAFIPSKSQFPSVVSCMVEGTDYVGGLIGYAESRLYCLASASTVTASGSYAGGIAGYAGIYDGSPIQRCVFMGSLGCQGSHVGGIAGYLANAVNGKTSGGFLRDCVNYSEIRGGDYTGGIVGNVDYTSGVRMELHWSVNLGKVNGGVPCGGLIGKCDGNGGVGMGMVGLANYGDVNSSASGNTSGVGGVIGHARSTHIAINGAMNKGDIHAEGRVNGIGGVVGVLGHDPGGVYQDHNGEMYWSANYGTVSCSNPESYAGGVCGWLEEGYSGGRDSYIHDCYNIGEVTTNHNSDTGGILGYVDHFGRIERCINFGNVSYGNATIGTQKPACIFYHSDLNMIDGTGKDWCADRKIKSSEQGDQSKYKGISFDNTNWKMTGGRPHLASNRFEDVVPPQQ